MANPLSGAANNRLPGPVDLGKQAETLNESHRYGMGMLPRERLELTRVSNFFFFYNYRLIDKLRNEPVARKQWYVSKLGKYDNQLKESASANRIPVRLLAAVILNELADIDPRDVLQQQLITNLGSGSLGVAQIEVSTVLKHNLLRGYLVHPDAHAAAQLLAVPQYSIEACAREIRHLLDLMEADPHSTWPDMFKFVPPPPGDNDPQRYYKVGVITLNGQDSDEDREAVIAHMVASAYNGGDSFITAKDPEKKSPNSYINGVTGETIARDLFQFNLFGDQ